MIGRTSFGPWFETAEFTDRLRRVGSMLDEHGLDLLVVVDPAHMSWLTGYEGYSFYTPQAVIVGGGLTRPLWFGRLQDTPCARYSTWLHEDDLVGYPERLVSAPDLNPYDHLEEVLAARGLRPERIGVELDAPYFSPRAHAAMVTAVAPARLVDVGTALNRLRARKSEQEIEYLRLAARMSDRAMSVAVAAMRAGRQQHEVAAAIHASLVEGVDGVPGHYPGSLHMPTGSYADAPHLSWLAEPFAAPMGVNLELGGCCHRYSAGLARTVSVGRPTPALRDVFELAREGVEAVLATARAGVRCSDVAREAHRRLLAGGVDKTERIGYAIGLDFGPTWIEGSASLAREDDTVLEAGMSFHTINGMWRGSEASAVCSETFVVTSSGVEVLTNYPRELTEA